MIYELTVVIGLAALTLTAHTILWAVPHRGTLKVGETGLRDSSVRRSYPGRNSILPAWFLDVGNRRLDSDYRTLYGFDGRFLVFVYFATVALSTLIMPLLVYYYSTLHCSLYPL